MKKNCGFTLVEFVIFLVIFAIFASAAVIPFKISLGKVSVLHSEINAAEVANCCMEYYLGQRKIYGFSATLTCPAFCNISGYSIATSITNTAITGDATSSAYKKIVVTVTGRENAQVTSLIADY